MQSNTVLLTVVTASCYSYDMRCPSCSLSTSPAHTTICSRYEDRLTRTRKPERDKPHTHQIQAAAHSTLQSRIMYTLLFVRMLIVR